MKRVVIIKEIWKIIDGYSNYEVSNFGRIRRKNGKIRKTQIHYKGYELITLRNDNGERKTLKVHRLVAKAFVHNPKNLPQVNHKDCNKLNNKADNLEWCNNSYNQKHAFSNNLQNNKGEKNPRHKLSEVDVINLLQKGKYDTYENIAKDYGVSKSAIASIFKNKNWTQLHIK